MKYKSLDIFIVIAITFFSSALVLLVPTGNLPVRLLVLPLVFVLPGYTFMRAMFTHRTFGIPEQTVLVLGLSLIIVILGGLVLNFTKVGLQSTSWTIFLSSTTLIASTVTLIRQRGHVVPAVDWHNGGKVRFTLRQRLLFIMAAIILSGAVGVSILGAVHQPYPGFTQLWMLPAGEGSQQAVVRLGVNNMELTPMEYALNVSVNGKVFKNWSAIKLDIHEKWENTLVLPQMEQGGSLKVEAMLYRLDAPTQVYRHVLLWLGS